MPDNVTAGSPPPKDGKKKPVGALKNPVTWLIVLGVALVGGAFLLWQQNQSSSSSGSGTGSGTGTGTDDSGALGTLQGEIGNLQSSLTQAGQVTVPDVTGATVTDATATLTGAGLVADPQGAHGRWIVSSTSPAAGASVASGSTVTLTAARKSDSGGGGNGSGSSTGSGDGSGTTTSSGSGGSGSNGNGSGSSSGGGTPGSWTDTGQKWSANQLAQQLGIPESALRGSNRLGDKALGDPNAPIAKGAAFTFLKP